METRTAKVITRHSEKCPDRKKGVQWRRCNCRKSLLVYESSKGRNRYLTTGTRSWERAEKICQEWLDQFDPEKAELKRLRAEKERKEVRIEEAVALFLADMIARLGDNGTVAMARSLLGHVDPETKAVKRNGHLFDWLDRQLPRPAFVADITPTHLTAWRASWDFGDLTAAQRWGMVKGFFNFCESQGWLDDSPARKLKRPTVAKGNRTAVFSDEQYSEILDAVEHFQAAENMPAQTRSSLRRRLTVFLELMRWSGMALTDAIQFRADSVDAEGVLRYRRQKTGELATVPLPAHVVILLRDIPLERGSDPARPFSTENGRLGSDARKWQHRLQGLFEVAGIAAVKTDRGERKPHPHMLRDTFAVWHLRHGARLHTVAKMLGHSNTKTTERSYLPWVKELEEAAILDARNSLKHLPKRRGRKILSIA